MDGQCQVLAAPMADDSVFLAVWLPGCDWLPLQKPRHEPQYLHKLGQPATSEEWLPDSIKMNNAATAAFDKVLAAAFQVPPSPSLLPSDLIASAPSSLSDFTTATAARLLPGSSFGGSTGASRPSYSQLSNKRSAADAAGGAAGEPARKRSWGQPAMQHAACGMPSAAVSSATTAVVGRAVGVPAASCSSVAAVAAARPEASNLHAVQCDAAGMAVAEAEWARLCGRCDAAKDGGEQVPQVVLKVRTSFVRTNNHT